MPRKLRFFIRIFAVIFIIFTSIICYRVFIKNTDLTIYGFIQQADGLGRQPIDLINMLEGENIDINFIGKVNSTKDLNSQVKSVLRNKNYKIGKVFINEEQISDKKYKFESNFYKILSKINGIDRSKQIWFAYSMFESDKISPIWVKELNKNYDAVIVPDQSLIPIYENSGVNIPIFMVPLSVDLKAALAAPLKTKANPIFTFANFSAIEDRKNTFKLVQAFTQAFGNNPNVRLLISTRRIDYFYNKKLIDYIVENNITPIL